MSAGDKPRRGRRLSAEERALWKGVVRSIAPLRKRVAPDDDADAEGAAAPAPVKSKPKAAIVSAPPLPKPPPAPAPSTLDRRTRKRIARGRDTIDGRLDLHGRTQAEAHTALLGFLRSSQVHGARTVLVITGKGGATGERGVLKRQVPMWLSLPEFRAFVIGFESAGLGHGGEGALYVRLRRAR